MGAPCDPAVPGAQPAPVQLVTARSVDGGSWGGRKHGETMEWLGGGFAVAPRQRA